MAAPTSSPRTCRRRRGGGRDRDGADASSTTRAPGSRSAEIQNCAMCHQGSQGSVWSTAPSRAACGACHDLHLVRLSAASRDDASPGRAADDRLDVPEQPGATAPPITTASPTCTRPRRPIRRRPCSRSTINSVTNTHPGQTPVVHFSVTENGAAARHPRVTPLPWLAATLAGPTTDYAQAEPLLYTIENGAGRCRGSSSTAPWGATRSPCPPPSRRRRPGATPSAWRGTCSQPARPGPVYAALNPVAYVAVTDPAPVPRRTVVDARQVQQLPLRPPRPRRHAKEPRVLRALPHAEQGGRPERSALRGPRHDRALRALQGDGPQDSPRQRSSRRGTSSAGYPGPTAANPAGTPVDFGKVLFPGDLRACWACHASTSYLPPLPAGLLPTVAQEVLACTDPTLDASAYCADRGGGEPVAAPAAQRRVHRLPRHPRGRRPRAGEHGARRRRSLPRLPRRGPTVGRADGPYAPP